MNQFHKFNSLKNTDLNILDKSILKVDYNISSIQVEDFQDIASNTNLDKIYIQEYRSNKTEMKHSTDIQIDKVHIISVQESIRKQLQDIRLQNIDDCRYSDHSCMLDIDVLLGRNILHKLDGTTNNEEIFDLCISSLDMCIHMNLPEDRNQDNKSNTAILMDQNNSYNLDNISHIQYHSPRIQEDIQEHKEYVLNHRKAKDKSYVHKQYNF